MEKKQNQVKAQKKKYYFIFYNYLTKIGINWPERLFGWLQKQPQNHCQYSLQ